VMTGTIGGFESPTHYLPSLAAQRDRRDAIPEVTQMRARLQQATADLPLHAATSPTGAYIDIDADKVSAALAGLGSPGEAVVLDLKRAADDLYSTYLAQIVKLSALGLGAIIVLLLIALRSGIRMLRVVAPLALAVLVVAAGLVLAGR